MFGYQTRNYSNRYVGICQCGSCWWFTQYSGMKLPKEEKEEDPAYIKYKVFKKLTTEDFLSKIYRKVKTLNSEVTVCTYSHRNVDLMKSESNSVWVMASENNVSCVRESYPDKRNFEGVKRIFRFHEKYEGYFSSLHSCASLLLVSSLGSGTDAYSAVILPGVEGLPKSTVEDLEKSGAVIIGTGLTFRNSRENLKRLFSVTLGKNRKRYVAAT